MKKQLFFFGEGEFSLFFHPQIRFYLPRFLDVCLESTYGDREVERAFVEASRKDFEEKTNPSLMLATNVGNM